MPFDFRNSEMTEDLLVGARTSPLGSLRQSKFESLGTLLIRTDFAKIECWLCLRRVWE